MPALVTLVLTSAHVSSTTLSSCRPAVVPRADSADPPCMPLLLVDSSPTLPTESEHRVCASGDDDWLELLTTEVLGSIGFNFSLRSPLTRRRRCGTLCKNMGLPIEGLLLEEDNPGPPAATGAEVGPDDELPRLSRESRSPHAITC